MESVVRHPATLADAASFDALSVEAASVVTQESAWTRVRKSLSVRLGAYFLLLLVAIALLAPWLGTVDPSLFDPASRDLLPGRQGEITTLEGETLKHRFLMGSEGPVPPREVPGLRRPSDRHVGTSARQVSGAASAVPA